MDLMRVDTLAPDPRLAHLVRRYQVRTASLRDRQVRIPLAARPDVLLEFYFTRPHLVEHGRTGRRHRTAWAVGVGPQSFQAATLILSGEIDVFTVHLRPTGLHALFGVPMPLLTNAATEAEHLLGSARTRELHERLAGAHDLAGRARIMDDALLALAPTPKVDPMAAAAEGLRRTHGAEPLGRLAGAVGLSERQFRRLFTQRVGMGPKLYARVVRLTSALERKAADPDSSWTDIAHAFGWFDQAHLDKDFQALAGASPSAFVRARQPAVADPY